MTTFQRVRLKLAVWIAPGSLSPHLSSYHQHHIRNAIIGARYQDRQVIRAMKRMLAHREEVDEHLARIEACMGCPDELGENKR